MDALYQEKILAFARSSRESEVVPDADATATVSNPVCGDRVEVRLKLDENNIVTAASTDVRGCALCEAGAGLFVNMAPGLESASLSGLHANFSGWLAGDDDNDVSPPMQDFHPVRNIRNRHKCVLLAFEAAARAVNDKS
ncbi:MAG: iron-sulfur cluster assembly scaffold protein [Alphaproteobacteria bacterium]|jgi:nitrogen fixation NifU-like protein